MRYFNRSQPFRKDKIQGFTIVELIITLIILGILAGVAIPAYVNAKVQGAAALAVSDGQALAQQINSMVLGVTDFGSTNGVILVTNISSPATITITLGTGATSPGDSTERIDSNTTVTGVTYAGTNTWCINVLNNTKRAIVNNTGYQKALTSCP